MIEGRDSARIRKQARRGRQRLALRLWRRGPEGSRAALGGLLECTRGQDAEPICSVLIADERGRLRHGAAPRLDDGFRHAFDGIDDRRRRTLIPCGTGAPGAAPR
jgi:hypothetical protein